MNKNKILALSLVLLGVTTIIIVLAVALRGIRGKSVDEISRNEKDTNKDSGESQKTNQERNEKDINKGGGESQKTNQESISEEKKVTTEVETINITPNNGAGDDSGAEESSSSDLETDPTPQFEPTFQKETIVDFTSEPHFLADVKVPKDKYALPSSVNFPHISDKLTEFRKQRTAAALHQIVLDCSISPDKAVLSELLLLIKGLLSKQQWDKYLGFLENFVQLQMELLNFSVESPVGIFVREKLLKAPILVSYAEFTSLIFQTGTLISSLDLLHLENLLTHLASVSAFAKKENDKKHYSVLKHGLFSYYYLLEKKFSALGKMIELCKVTLPPSLATEYKLLIQSGFSYEKAIEFVQCFYSKVPIPSDDSIFSVIDELFSMTISVDSVLNYEGPDIPSQFVSFPKGPLPYYEYKRLLGLFQVPIELSRIEKSLKLADGTIFKELFSDLTTFLPPLQTFDSALFKYRDVLFRDEKMTLALDRYNSGANEPNYFGVTTYNDLSAIYSNHKSVALSKLKVENFLSQLVKSKPDLEKKLTDLVNRILKLPFDKGSDNDLRSSLVALWDLISPLENIKSPENRFPVIENLMEAIYDYFYWNLQYEYTFPERLKMDVPNDRKLFQELWSNVWRPIFAVYPQRSLNESKWKIQVSEWRSFAKKKI
jgi:hypothetical protein